MQPHVAMGALPYDLAHMLGAGVLVLLVTGELVTEESTTAARELSPPTTSARIANRPSSVTRMEAPVESTFRA